MTEITELQGLKKNIENLKEQISPILKDDTDKWVQIACNFIEQKWDKIKDASRPSLFSELLKIAQMGLYLDGEECSIVVFKGTAKRMTGYRGLLKLVRNSGELASINAGVVYDKDSFDYYVDEKGEHLTHKPSFAKERGTPFHTYCIARIKGSDNPYIEVMTEEQVQACRKTNRSAGEDSPWAGPFADEMRKKTVLRRISKRLPMSTDLRVVFNEEDDPQGIADDPIKKEEKTSSSSLESAVLQKEEQPKPSPAPAPQVSTPVSDLKNKFSNIATGEVLNISAKTFPATESSAERTRFSCKIGELFYGTWDRALFQKVEDLYNKKSEVSLKFVILLNSKKQPYNDILDVTEKIAEEAIPI